jgi:probable HAF family extracellular repeat protein
MMKPWMKVVPICSLFACLRVEAALTYHIEPLQSTDSDVVSTITGINNNGIVVGEGKTAASTYGATEWKDGTALHVPIGKAPSECANGINDAGVIVGAILLTDSEHAYFSNGVKTTLLPGDAGFAESINTNGEIVGASDYNDYQRATIWKDGKVIPLNVSDPTDASRAMSVNNRGDVAGSFEHDSVTHSFYYHDAKTTLLPSLKGAYDQVTDMNDQGEIVGYAVIDNKNGAGVVWQNGKIKVLGWDSIAFGINDQGLIVGESSVGPASTATLWTNGTAIDLNTLLPGDSGWKLSEADKINNRGQIAGIGTFHGVRQPFMLTPSPQAIPLPTSVWMSLTTLPLLGIALRRKQSTT